LLDPEKKKTFCLISLKGRVRRRRRKIGMEFSIPALTPASQAEQQAGTENSIPLFINSSLNECN